MSGNTKKTSLPKLQWKTATCEVCGNPFDYLSQKRPKICKNGDCQYKYHYKINEKSWATYQPSFFDN